MKLDEVYNTIADDKYSKPKDILKVLKDWVIRNTPKIGTLSISPRYQRPDADYLYRGIELTREDIKKIEAGGSIDFASKGFSSWSEDYWVARGFAVKAGAPGVVLRVPTKKLKIWLDIDEFLFRNKFPPLDRREEREIIVQDAPMKITKDMLYDNDDHPVE
jgi:hypothetical protein